MNSLNTYEDILFRPLISFFVEERSDIAPEKFHSDVVAHLDLISFARIAQGNKSKSARFIYLPDSSYLFPKLL